MKDQTKANHKRNLGIGVLLALSFALLVSTPFLLQNQKKNQAPELIEEAANEADQTSDDSAENLNNTDDKSSLEGDSTEQADQEHVNTTQKPESTSLATAPTQAESKDSVSKKSQGIVSKLKSIIGIKPKTGTPTQSPSAPTSVATTPSAGTTSVQKTNKTQPASKPNAKTVAEASKQEPQLKKPEAPKASCYTVQFKHKNLHTHRSGEACTAHKNLLTLPGHKALGINAKSTCVRVNGTPIEHRFIRGKKGQPDRILFAALAGPNSEVSATYCTGRTKCNENCVVPKDDFMAAIGGLEDDLLDTGEYVKWDPSNKNQKKGKVEAKLDSELKKLRTDLKKSKMDRESVFNGWIRGKEKASCQSKSGQLQAKR